MGFRFFGIDKLLDKKMKSELNRSSFYL